MASENGRRFADDLARFTAGERRELVHLTEERAAAAREREAAGAKLETLRAAAAAATLAGKEPPQNVREARRAFDTAEERIAACDTLRPEREHALADREAEWLEKQAPDIGKRNEQWIGKVSAAVRAADEVLAGYDEHRQDVTAAAPALAPPQLASVKAKHDYLLETLAAYPPKPAAPSDLVRVRVLPADQIKSLTPQHRLFNAIGSARAALVLERYGPGETLGLPPRLTFDKKEYRIEELAPYLGLERVPDEPGGAA